MLSSQLLSKQQLATVKSHIEAELRAVDANPKSTKQVKDRIGKLLGRASAYLEQVRCAMLACHATHDSAGKPELTRYLGCLAGAGVHSYRCFRAPAHRGVLN